MLARSNGRYSEARKGGRRVSEQFLGKSCVEHDGYGEDESYPEATPEVGYVVAFVHRRVSLGLSAGRRGVMLV